MQELALDILDIVQNSVAASATHIAIEVKESVRQDRLSLMVADNGCGMSPEELRRAADPFYTTRTARKVGLGLSLLQMECEQTGGRLQIFSEPGRGTRVYASLGLSHIDRPPLGDVASTLATLVLCCPDIRFTYTHRTKNGAFSADSRLLCYVPDMQPLSLTGKAALIHCMIGRGLERIEGGRS